ncbi:CapA family protein [Aestuariimicrobium ganziense]|uniref:CapA family protein n=1 Tax=Aestuariimicrobium ganziense TaxID=2773677 RepID=UPI001942EAA9|nr:CapA family protein [Aestuariimicrobium ganziense]
MRGARGWLRTTHAAFAVVAATSLLLSACAKDLSTPQTTPSVMVSSVVPTSAASSSGSSSSAVATSTPSTSPTPTATQGSQQRTASLVFSGDLLWHNTLWMSAADDHRRTGKGKEFDFDPMFAAIKPVISGADLAVCHEEVPFAKPGGPYTGYPTFKAPPAIAEWIPTMGWDACTLTSNHALDAGITGLERTNRLLRDNGVTPIGTRLSADEVNKPVMLTTENGIKVSIIGSTYGLNGLVPPQGKEYAVQMIEVPELLRQAKLARQAGADLVLVQMHAGDEYAHKPNAQQVETAKALTASPDVDAVIGQHVHVVQPITKVNGKWVVYGMGNMVAQHKTDVPRGYEGITVRLNVKEKAGAGFEVAGVDYIPTYVTHYSPGNPVRLLPVVDSLSKGVGPTERLTVAREKTRAAVLLLGDTPGLVER